MASLGQSAAQAPQAAQRSVLTAAYLFDGLDIFIFDTISAPFGIAALFASGHSAAADAQ